MKILLHNNDTQEEIIFTVPKKWEFYFKKDEYEYTDKEWDLLENKPFLGFIHKYDDIDIIKEIK